VPKLCSPDGRDLATAIYDLNLDALFPLDVDAGPTSSQLGNVVEPAAGRSLCTSPPALSSPLLARPEELER